MEKGCDGSKLSWNRFLKVQAGQEGYLEVLQLGNRPFESILARDITITNLVASSAQRGKDVLLLDDRGCSVVKDLIKPFEPVDGARIWRARIKFFAFNDTSNKIHFSGLVKPCIGSCEPAELKCKETYKSAKSLPVRLKRHDRLQGSDRLRDSDADLKGQVIVLSAEKKSLYKIHRSN